MNAKHTPRPWEYSRVDDEKGGWLCYEIGKAFNLGSKVVARTAGCGPTAEANARLITAAPDLLTEMEAVKERLSQLPPETIIRHSLLGIIERAYVVIQKARGGA